LLAFVDAMCLAGEPGMKEIARLDQARQLMERNLRGRRSTSSLPAAIELILSRPVVSAAMVAKAADVTPRGALHLIAELGVREMTGRGAIALGAFCRATGATLAKNGREASWCWFDFSRSDP